MARGRPLFVAVVAITVAGGTVVGQEARDGPAPASWPWLVAGTPGPSGSDSGAAGGTRPVATRQIGPATTARTDEAEDIVTVVHELVAARATALRRGDAAALGAVHVTGSAVLAADTAAIASGPLDVDYEVVAVAVLDGLEPGGDRDSDGGSDAVIDVRTRIGARPAVAERVVLSLVRRRPDGWSIAAVGRMP